MGTAKQSLTVLKSLGQMAPSPVLRSKRSLRDQRLRMWPSSSRLLSIECSGSIQIPWSVTVTGDYLIKLSAAGEQYGPDPVKIGLALTAALPNTQNEKIKQQLQTLHQQLLGETLALDDPELAYSYELVEEAFAYRSTLDNPNLNQWPAQQCNNQNWRTFQFRHVRFYTDEGGLDDIANLFHDGLSVSP